MHETTGVAYQDLSCTYLAHHEPESIFSITIICYRCCATGKTDVALHHAQLSSYMHTPVAAGCILCRTGTATIHAFAAVRAALPTLRSLVLE